MLRIILTSSVSVNGIFNSLSKLHPWPLSDHASSTYSLGQSVVGFPIITNAMSFVKLIALRGHLEKDHIDPLSALGTLAPVCIIHRMLPKMQELIPLTHRKLILEFPQHWLHVQWLSWHYEWLKLTSWGSGHFCSAQNGILKSIPVTVW